MARRKYADKKHQYRDKFFKTVMSVTILAFALFCYADVINKNVRNIDIDSYVRSCELSEPYTCLDASFDGGYIEFATYGRHDDIVVEGCAHMTMREHDNGKHIIDIYGFRCARGDDHLDIYIDGNKEGHIEFSEMTGW